MPARLKFDDCKLCRHKRTATCHDCDFGEYFEEIPAYGELDFSEGRLMSGPLDKSSLNDESAGNIEHDPDNLISRALAEADEREDRERAEMSQAIYAEDDEDEQ